MLLLLSKCVYATDNTTKNKNEEIERIIVSGKGDVALQAFNSGNFSLAEIKFKENSECALRAELSEADYFDSFQSQQASQASQAESLSPRLSANPDSINVNPNANVTFTPSSGVQPQRNTQVRKHTCENRGFQIYMTGMSQIQLGRAEEAEANLEQAIDIDNYLYDAHYRLALIKLLRQDKAGVSQHLSAIESALARCHRCDFKHEIKSRIKFLEHAVDGKIKLK
jgi:Tfp pilus assembly protein PilF